jgi:hypothetical protein
MFNAGKSSQSPRNVRLPKQSAMPSYGDIQFLMQEANKILGRWVELPYSASDRKQEYILSVKYDNREEDPNWSLFQITANAGQTAIWNYASRDLSLIANLIMTSSGGDQLEDVIPSSALMGKAGETTMMTGPVGGLGQTAHQSHSGTGINFDPPRPGAKATLEGKCRTFYSQSI